MTTTDVRHPAKFSDPILDVIARYLQPEWNVLDPFAGVGRVHELGERVGCRTVGVEIEPEWANVHPKTVVGDALRLPEEWTGVFDAIVTSPTYGNRMADHHEAKDGSRRITYRHTLGRALSDNNSGQLQWGKKYRSFHERAWNEAVRVLRVDGVFVLNISDHVRAGKVMPVTAWHLAVLRGKCGLELVERVEVETTRMRFGENREMRVAHETVAVLRKVR